MKHTLLGRSVVLLSLAAVVVGCSDDGDDRPGRAGSSGSGGSAGASGAAGAAASGGSAGSAGSSGAAGAAGAAGTGGAGNDAGASVDYDALCTQFCDAAAAYQSGAGATIDAGAGDAGVTGDAGAADAGSGTACETDIPDCLATCVATGEAFEETPCADHVRVMYECFVSDDTWFCGGEPSSPNPAGCIDEQTEFALCTTEL